MKYTLLTIGINESDLDKASIVIEKEIRVIDSFPEQLKQEYIELLEIEIERVKRS